MNSSNIAIFLLCSIQLTACSSKFSTLDSATLSRTDSSSIAHLSTGSGPISQNDSQSSGSTNVATPAATSSSSAASNAISSPPLIGGQTQITATPIIVGTPIPNLPPTITATPINGETLIPSLPATITATPIVAGIRQSNGDKFNYSSALLRDGALGENENSIDGVYVIDDQDGEEIVAISSLNRSSSGKNLVKMIFLADCEIEVVAENIESGKDDEIYGSISNLKTISQQSEKNCSRSLGLIHDFEQSGNYQIAGGDLLTARHALVRTTEN